MTFRDMLEISLGNLRRMKLRAFLTISGIVIAIGAFVAMLSFAAGNYKYINDRYEGFGLFSTMMVYPVEKGEKADTVETAVLDRTAIDELSKIPGVRLAYPYDAFEVTITTADTTITSKARSLSSSVLQTKLYSDPVAGGYFSSDSAGEALLALSILDELGVDSAATLIGTELILSTKAPSLDSALLNIVRSEDGSIIERLREIRFDSLFDPEYRRRVMEKEMNEGISRFVDGFMRHQLTISDTLIIRGVIDAPRTHRLGSAPIIIPEETARRLSRGSFGLSGDPTEMFAAMQRGNLFSFGEEKEHENFPQVTLDIDPYVNVTTIADSVKALGFRTFSFAEQFEEIQRFFLYFHMTLAVIGLLALFTASLGIVNTMVMSIIERRREIGVLKSLGAHEGAINRLFLMESAVIGGIGASVGILLGWIVSRIASAIIKYIMEQQGVPVHELFALPLWLIALSFSFGVLVALIAGFYPASRAARVDPVEALRAE